MKTFLCMQSLKLLYLWKTKIVIKKTKCKLFYDPYCKSTFPDAMAAPSLLAQRPIKRISSFAMWMEAWNLYLSVIANHNPNRALQILPCQYVIRTENKLQYYHLIPGFNMMQNFVPLQLSTLPFTGIKNTRTSGWMLMLPAAMSNIIGPVRIVDQPTITQKIVPNCLFIRANHLTSLPISEYPPITHDRFAGSKFRGTAPGQRVNTATSVHHAKVITPSLNVPEIGVNLLLEPYSAPGRPLTLECDTINDRQLQIFSKPKHNSAQHQICHATYTP